MLLLVDISQIMSSELLKEVENIAKGQARDGMPLTRRVAEARIRSLIGPGGEIGHNLNLIQTDFAGWNFTPEEKASSLKDCTRAIEHASRVLAELGEWLHKNPQ